MAVVEDLIVAMGFDNKQFESAVKVSMFTLQTLKTNLNFGGGKNGIDQAAESAARFNAAPMNASVDGISAKFLAMSTVAITALSNITNKAVDAGINLAKSFTIAPISDGFAEYETKLGSIQTILANTSSDYANQADGLKDVTANLEELNTYSDKTIYSFGDMTKNIGLFTNAGIGVADATAMIKGFSNEAAASGTTAEGAAGAAYQLSQALSAGQITLMDWKSLTNVGMGNANMKDGIIQIADAMGAFEGTTVTAEDAAKDFNGTLEKKWLSSDVMSNYLKIQAEGNAEVNRETLKGLGLSDEQTEKFIKQQATAQDAATKVRSFTALMGTLKESVGSSWAQTTELILGDFNEATDLFTGINNTLGGMIGSFGTARNDLLKGWAGFGGREKLVEGLGNVFEGLLSVMRPIGEAFRQIFPPMLVGQLVSMTESFRKFSEGLTVSGETADKIKRIFSGIFAVFGIVWEVVKGLAGGVAQLFGAFQGGSGGILSVSAAIGDFVVKVYDAIKGGDVFGKIFGVIGTILSGPIAALGNLGTAIGEILGSLGDASGAAQQFFDIIFRGDFKGGGPLQEDSQIVDTLFDIRDAFVNTFSAIEQFWNVLAKGDFVGGFFEEDSPIIDFFFDLREAISSFFSSDGLKLLLAGGAGVGLGLAVKKMLQSAFKFGSEDSESFFGTIKGAFASARSAFDGVSGVLDQVTDSFKAMQQNLQAGTLLKIGAAIGIVAISLKLLSTIDPVEMAVALGGVVTAMGALLGAMAILTKISGSGAFATIPALAVAMIGLSIAVLILSVAVKSLAELSWQELLMGLGGLAGILLLVVGAAYGLSKAEGPLMRAGLAMIPFAAAVKILVSAVKDLSTMEVGDLVTGLSGLAGILVGVTAALNFMPKDMPAIGFGLLLVSGALAVMAQVVQTLGGMAVASLVQGLAGVGVGLGILAIALKAMPSDLPSLAAALLVAAGALVLMAQAVTMFADLSWEELAKGMVGLGASLAILAIGLQAIAKGAEGAEAIAVAAAGLILLMIPIGFFASLSWEALIKGLLGLAGVFGVLGAAGYLLGPVLPVLSSLGIAMALIGVGLGAVGLGALAFATALKLMIEIVMLGQDAIVQLMQLIPQMAAALATGITTFLVTLAESAGEIATAFTELLGGLLDSVIELIPKIQEIFGRLLNVIIDLIITNAPRVAEAINALIAAFLDVLNVNGPKIIDTVFNLMMAFLQTVRDRIPDIVTVVTDIIVAFIGALQQNLPRIVQAGFEFIIGFMNSLAESIRSNLPLVGEAAGNIASAIIEGIIGGIKAGAYRVFQSLKDMASGALQSAKEALGIASPSKEFFKVGAWTAEGMANGIDAGKASVSDAGRSLAQNLLGSVDDELGKLGGTAKTVFDILAFGDYTNNGGVFDEDSPAVDTLFNLRDGFMGIVGAAGEAVGAMASGNFANSPLLQANSPIVSTLKDMRDGFFGINGAAEETISILGKGDFQGIGPWQEDSPMVDTLFNLREGFVGVGDAAGQAFGIMNEGDFKGNGPWAEDSPIVDTLFDIREGFEQFNGVGEDAIQGLINGFNDGTVDIVVAAQNMANSALQAARDTLGIQSPSKEFQNIGEYSIEGLIVGLKSGGEKVNGQGKTLANGLMNGFSKGLGKEMPKAIASIFETLRTGTADVKFWGPNNPATIQLQNMNKALQEAELRLAAFYGEVNLADPASIEAYVEKTGNSLKYLTGLLNGMEKAANTAFEMLESGKGLDVVLGDEAVLNNLLDGILSVIPGVEAMLVRLGFAVVDGFLGIFFDTSVMGIVGDFITFAIRQIGALFGIEFPIEEELDDANKELEDFLVNVEDTQGRFDKLTKAGIASLTTTLTEANEAVDALDHNPTITPVLDLTEYNKQKAGMGADAPIAGFTPEASAFQAQSLYDERKEFEAIQAAEQNANKGTEHKFGSISFVQTNNSPIPLGHVDIYKATKGLLSNAKEALNIS